ncbi:hypothetical protein J1N35_018161 [Gossypium stocksii]|uniref:Uncharacterized protein n=1 Tax=Gossypium stocksii TaxID=47602 RepID=A0A9D3VNR2_9ROSI|nr:hypothetical protein J1N35_018161 [Gossypium stocksii]
MQPKSTGASESTNEVTLHASTVMFRGEAGTIVKFYYIKLESLWDELNSYEDITCRSNYAIAPKLIHHAETEMTHQYLMGLDDSIFGQVHGCNKGRANSPVGHTEQSSSQQKQGMQHPKNMELVIHILDGSLDFGNNSFARLTTDKSNDYYH